MRLLLKNSLPLQLILVSLIIAFLIVLVFLLVKNLKKSKVIREKSLNEKKLEEQLQVLNEKMIMQKQEIRIREREEKEFNWYMSGLAKFSDLMYRHKNNIETLSSKLLSSLVKYMEAQQGGIFLLNDEGIHDFLR